MSDDRPLGYASPPCLAHEVDPAYFDPLAVDPQQAADVARWRRTTRERLLAERAALPASARTEMGRALAAGLDALLAEQVGPVSGRIVSAYWPIKCEPDLRGWLRRLLAAGATTALPVVETRAAPLVFRCWRPGARMTRGHWNILVPPEDAGTVTPEVTIAPLVGWDAAGYRLGYGGGYFDRTLAALSPAPFVIGVGLEAARLATIYPQPHDVPMDAIVTEAGLRIVRGR
ncbi:5-formyltetrahydrofolate cyclo-ligase [Roseitranquillus sediminis]|uniref:5-formyltetrahydrofolate cyclo-ligase n=1 Tax=Roseitranquillus sediminis TaxID=2809051 RepID=UPI001D0BF635|nr:5-formyltetrahydrofolate cyclo-ligase [Roseitranquillus sediminis]MBM9593579.1 5-formyltetrahydrofolate cyclo-ligase [Roseitranquillus sediminis]